MSCGWKNIGKRPTLFLPCKVELSNYQLFCCFVAKSLLWLTTKYFVLNQNNSRYVRRHEQVIILFLVLCFVLLTWFYERVLILMVLSAATQFRFKRSNNQLMRCEVKSLIHWYRDTKLEVITEHQIKLLHTRLAPSSWCPCIKNGEW